MMASMWDMVPLVRPEMRDCMDVVIQDAIRRAAIAFCEDTYIWEVDATAIQTAVDTPEYAVSVGVDQLPIMVSRVFNSHGQLIKSVTRREMDQANPGWTLAKGPSPLAWIQLSPSRIRFYPVPSATETITLQVVVRPTSTATTIDQGIMDEYSEGIAAKAKAILGSMPHKAWTNYELVPFWEKQYQDYVRMAKMRLATGFTNTAHRVVPVRFGG